MEYILHSEISKVVPLNVGGKTVLKVRNNGFEKTSSITRCFQPCLGRWL